VNLYRISYVDGKGNEYHEWKGTQVEVKQRMKALSDSFDYCDEKVESVYVEPSKAGILKLLNQYCNVITFGE